MRTIAWTPLKTLRRQDEGAVALDGPPMEMLEGSEGSGSISCGAGVFLIDARRTSEASVNALFNAELRYLVETFDAAEVTGNQNFLVLLDLSLSRRGRCQESCCVG